MINQEQLDYINLQWSKLYNREMLETTLDELTDIIDMLQAFPCIIIERHGARRWSERVDYVYQVGDRFFCHSFDEPLTEMQDGQDTDDEITEVGVGERTVVEKYFYTL